MPEVKLIPRSICVNTENTYAEKREKAYTQTKSFQCKEMTSGSHSTIKMRSIPINKISYSTVLTL